MVRSGWSRRSIGLVLPQRRMRASAVGVHWLQAAGRPPGFVAGKAAMDTAGQVVDLAAETAPGIAAARAVGKAVDMTAGMAVGKVAGRALDMFACKPAAVAVEMPAHTVAGTVVHRRPSVDQKTRAVADSSPFGLDSRYNW